MFPRDQRIRTSRDILQVLRRGDRRSNGAIACSFLSKPGTITRIGVIVDSKVSKRAVVRNLVKRRVRAILQQRASLPVGDIIIRAYKGAETLEFSRISEHIEQCLRRLNRS